MSDNNALTETEIKIADCVALGIPPGNWVPPEEPQLVVTVSQRNNYSTTLDEINGEISTIPDSAFDPPEEGSQGLGARSTMSVQAFSLYPKPENFEHTDLEKYSELQAKYRELQESDTQKQPTFKSAETALQDGPTQTETFSLEGSVATEQLQELQLLQDLKTAEVEYKRLELAFKLVVSNIGEACTALNYALKTKNGYAQAREAYMSLLRNVNIHDPTPDQIDPKKGFGYGQVLGWTIADVVVDYDRTHEMNLITGVTIVSEWIGYHTSSSGVPIPDRP
jgi:hypothetical protein